METTSRLLRLLSLLQTRRFWPGPELAERLGVSARTLRRDVDRLWELTEVYESPAGVEDHWKQGAENWPEFSDFLTWANEVEICVLHGSPVIHSLW